MAVLALTGATGHVGGRAARLLGPAVSRLVVRDASRAPRIDGDPQVVEATYGDAAAVARALAGVDVLLMVSGGESPHRRFEHRGFVRETAEAGVRHVVYTGFDAAGPDAIFALGRDHWDTEQAIRRSGMAWTFLHDSFYSDFFAVFADENGVTRGPAGDGRVAAVGWNDVADVAAAVLADPAAHKGAAYTLTGPEPVSFAEAAARMTAALGRPFRFEDPSRAGASSPTISGSSTPG